MVDLFNFLLALYIIIRLVRLSWDDFFSIVLDTYVRMGF